MSKRSAATKSPTARPRSLRDEMKRRPVAEEGLSADADELGRQFLADATLQENFESEEGGQNVELSATGAPASDAALSGATFDADNGVWDETVDITLQEDGTEEVQRQASPEGVEPDGADDEEPQQRTAVRRRVNLRDNVTVEASLFDDEGDELGEVRSPDLDTDDSPRRVTRPRTPG